MTGPDPAPAGAAASAAAWDGFAARHWAREPVVLPAPGGTGAVDPRLAYAVMVEAAWPFRTGTRFRALPDVRFLVDGGRIRAPGDLLPGPGDTTAARYADRLDTRMEGRGRLLAVEQPLMLDHRLWAGVRELVAPLWERVGHPVLPVVSELALGDGAVDGDGLAREPVRSTLVWVLRGTLTAVPHGPAGGPAPTAGAGDLLHWPAGRPYALRYGARTLALRLLVPGDPRLLTEAVKDVVAGMLHERRGDDRVPYLPHPPATGDGPAPDVPHLAEAGRALREVTGADRLDRALGVLWARRASAAALEPVPDPRPPVRLAPDDRVRPGSPVVRMPLEDGRSWVWAVDGHAFSLRGALGERVLERLRRDGAPTVRELCALAGPGREEGVVALLEKLYALRGVDVAGREAPR
ncbi:hypothetical protein [Streptomyces roseolilacinus]|uniref:Uncharacterized protein n=1 Tax=Streptomyces roseolilacinus TaxID=66904 RepID=A0A918AWJ0_9ACTN|nr:hypothetical protein [Streptomyces roseolilacinus]GGP93640.1 hypothetical protein GCM10010249_09210 [Streptomyces roseolilacinus]